MIFSSSMGEPGQPWAAMRARRSSSSASVASYENGRMAVASAALSVVTDMWVSSLGGLATVTKPARFVLRVAPVEAPGLLPGLYAELHADGSPEVVAAPARSCGSPPDVVPNRAAHPGQSATSAQRPPPGSCGAQSASMRVTASRSVERVTTDIGPGDRATLRAMAAAARDAPSAHAALPPAHSAARPWLGPTYRERPTLQALRCRAARPRRTGRDGNGRSSLRGHGCGTGLRFSSLDSLSSGCRPHSASRRLREPKTVHLVCPSHPSKPLV